MKCVFVILIVVSSFFRTCNAATIVDEGQLMEWYLTAVSFEEMEYDKCPMYMYYPFGCFLTQPLSPLDLAKWYMMGTAIKIGLKYDQFKQKKEYKEAINNLTNAAENGNGKAQFLLGLMCETGVGMEQCIEKAINWYQKSVSSGFERANGRLRACYMSEPEQAK